MSKMKDFLIDVMEMYESNHTPTQIANFTGMPVTYIMEIIATFDDEGWDGDEYETEPA